ASMLIHGHTHRAGDESIGPGLVRHVLSDWDLDNPTSRPRAEVLRWQADGMRRLAPAEAMTVTH
ncbi:MAG: UDP-2,3-diacylglucosamine diphosphatase, partial [Caldimonas sp.]